MMYIDTVQTIPESETKFKLSFSSVQWSDLSNMGLQYGHLRSKHQKLGAHILGAAFDPKLIEDLAAHIIWIRGTIGTMPEYETRMILDAVLMTVSDISAVSQKKLHMGIRPDMCIAAGDGVPVKNPHTRFEAWLSGTFDYGICAYEKMRYRDDVLESSFDDLVTYGYVKNYSTLVAAKSELAEAMPRAISQAIALSEVTGNHTIRYCLSDGYQWQLALYTRDKEGKHVAYGGPVLTIAEPQQQAIMGDIQYLVEVLSYWFTADGDPKDDLHLELE